MPGTRAKPLQRGGELFWQEEILFPFPLHFSLLTLVSICLLAVLEGLS